MQHARALASVLASATPLLPQQLDVAADYALQLLQGSSPPAPVEPIPGAATPLGAAAASIAAWGAPLAHGATAAGLRSAAAVCSTEALQTGQSQPMPFRPSVNDPAAMLAAAPPAIRDARGGPLAPPAAGEPPSICPTALRRLHREHGCPTGLCGTAASACYIESMRAIVSACPLPWLPEGPPATEERPRDAAASPREDTGPSHEATRAFVAKLHAAGVVAVAPDSMTSVLVNPFFLDEKTLLPAAATPPDGTPPSALHRQALGIAERFAATFTAAATRGDPDAWGIALAATLQGGVKVRGIFNAKPRLNKLLSEWAFAYPKLNDFLYGVRRGGYFAKVDLKGGFYHVRMHPEAWRYLAFRFDGVTYYFKRLPMGLSCAPAVFSWITGELDRILRARGFAVTLIYVDDFLLYGDSKAVCDAALAALYDILGQLGMAVATDKSTPLGGSSQRLEGLGTVIDSTFMTVSLPTRSSVTMLAMAAIGVWAATPAAAPITVPRGFVDSLVGRIGWAGIIDLTLRPFTRCLTGLLNWEGSHSLSHPSMARHVRALRWLLDRAAAGTLATAAIIEPDDGIAGRVVPLTTDAMISEDPQGEAAIAFRVGSRPPVRLEIDRRSITGTGFIGVLELVAVYVGAVLTSEVTPGALISSGVDNSGVTFWVNKLRSDRADATDVLKALALLQERTGVGAQCHWLTREANHVCDRAAAPRAEALAAVPDLLLLGTYASTLDLLRAVSPTFPWDEAVWLASTTDAH